MHQQPASQGRRRGGGRQRLRQAGRRGPPARSAAHAAAAAPAAAAAIDAPHAGWHSRHRSIRRTAGPACTPGILHARRAHAGGPCGSRRAPCRQHKQYSAVRASPGPRAAPLRERDAGLRDHPSVGRRPPDARAVSECSGAGILWQHTGRGRRGPAAASTAAGEARGARAHAHAACCALVGVVVPTASHAPHACTVPALDRLRERIRAFQRE